MNGKKMMIILATALLLVPVIPMGLAAVSLTVNIGSKYYNIGDTVGITGKATTASTVALTTNMAGVTIPSVVAASDSYSASFQVPAGTAIGLYTITATEGSSTATADFIVTSVPIKDTAAEIVDLATKAQTLAQETLDSFKAAGKTVPESAQTNLDKGKAALAQAVSVLATDPRAAVQQAKLALTHFRNAIAIAMRGDKVEESRTTILTHTADRLDDLLRRIEESLTNLNQDKYAADITGIKAKLNPAKILIIDARALITAGSLDDAAAKLKTAADDVQQAFALYRALIAKVRSDMLGDFRFRLQERLTAAEGDIGKLGKYLSQEKVNSAMTSLGNAKGLMNRAGNSLNAHDNDEAADDLDDAAHEINAGVSSVGNGYGQGMGQVNLIRAQIQVLQEMADKLAQRGQDTSDLTAKIHELQAILDQATIQMVSGNAAAANSIIDAAKKGKHGLGVGQWMKGGD